MKKFLTAVAVAATMVSASAASATDRANGHWEWQPQSNPGPSRSILPSHRRVWVSDEVAEMAGCDHMKMDTPCTMAKAPRRAMGYSHPKN